MTTRPDPTYELVETLEYRGSTLYLYFRPEQDVRYDRDIYSWNTPDGKYAKGASLVLSGTEPVVDHHGAIYFVDFKEKTGGWGITHFSGSTKEKALKSAKHNVDLTLADEALQEPCIKLIGWDKTDAISDKFRPCLPPLPRPTRGDVVWLYSRGGWRRGLVEKVGRTNVTVAYTTQGSLDEKIKYNRKSVVITRKSAKFGEIAVEPRRVNGQGDIVSV